MEWREVHVISGLRADLGEQRAIDPVYDRSIHFTGPTKHPAVFLELGYENILHLQVSSWMQQRDGIHETFQGDRDQMEAMIHDDLADKILETTRFGSRRQWSVQVGLG